MFKEKFLNILKKYSTEFALIFISVILAFALTEWSSNRGEKISETKILSEIKNGINLDYKDFESNLKMHKISKAGVRELRKWVNNEEINNDSIPVYYYLVFRNYSPIINKTGYESLKETSLKTISNDSLRFQIIKLYDYHYNIIEQLENHNEEMQDFETYFALVNKILTPYMSFDEKGNLKNLQKANLSEVEKKELLSYLWRLELTKMFKIFRYEQVLTEIKNLDKSLNAELKTKR
ncbi:hypothetical protein [Algoriella sp.]|uniref:hypothetical protein n=1 Tax=Algoriella sp. TaxID=1872434 RepID=UPI002FC83EB1